MELRDTILAKSSIYTSLCCSKTHDTKEAKVTATGSTVGWKFGHQKLAQKGECTTFRLLGPSALMTVEEHIKHEHERGHSYKWRMNNEHRKEL